MIQRFLCPVCGATQEVPAGEGEIGAVEADCLCGAPVGTIEAPQPEPPPRPAVAKLRVRPSGGRLWVVVISALLLPLICWLVLLCR